MIPWQWCATVLVLICVCFHTTRADCTSNPVLSYSGNSFYEQLPITDLSMRIHLAFNVSGQSDIVIRLLAEQQCTHSTVVHSLAVTIGLMGSVSRIQSWTTKIYTLITKPLVCTDLNENTINALSTIDQFNAFWITWGEDNKVTVGTGTTRESEKSFMEADWPGLSYGLSSIWVGGIGGDFQASFDAPLPDVFCEGINANENTATSTIMTSPSDVTTLLTPTTSPPDVTTRTPATSAYDVTTTTPTTSASDVTTTTPTTSASDVTTTTPATSPYDITTTTPTTSPSDIKTTTPMTSPSDITTTTPATSPSDVTTTTPTTSPSDLTTRTPATSYSDVTTRIPATSPSDVTTRTPATSPSDVTTRTPATSPSDVATTTPTTSPSDTSAASPETSPPYVTGPSSPASSSSSFSDTPETGVPPNVSSVEPPATDNPTKSMPPPAITTTSSSSSRTNPAGDENCHCFCSSSNNNETSEFQQPGSTPDRSLLDKRTLSASVRRRTCAWDDRVSSAVIGVGTVLLAAAPVLMAVLSDALNCFRWLFQDRKRNQTHPVPPCTV